MTGLISDLQKKSVQEQKDLKLKVANAEAVLVRKRRERQDAETRKKRLDEMLSVVLSLNQELVGESSSPQKLPKNAHQLLQHRKDGLLVGGNKAAEAAYEANVSIAARKLLDHRGSKKSSSLALDLQRVYDALLVDYRESGGLHRSHNNYNGNSEEVAATTRLNAFPSANQHSVGLATQGIESSRQAEHLMSDDAGTSIYYDAENSMDNSMASSSAIVTERLIRESLTPPRSPAREKGSSFQKSFAGLKDAHGMILEEFNNLNAQYFEVVESAKQGGETDISDLLTLISNLHNKGEQLKLMRMSMQSRRAPVFSPEAIQRKTAALGILREYREASMT